MISNELDMSLMQKCSDITFLKMDCADRLEVVSAGLEDGE